MFQDTLATIIVSLVSGHSVRYRMDIAAAKFRFKFIELVELIEADFPGYTSKRNLSGTSFKCRHALINTDGKEMGIEYFVSVYTLSCARSDD